MARDLSLLLLLSFTILMSRCISCCSTNNCVNEIKGMFVFGSSLVDNGNNNFMDKSLAKANYLPYGIDFPFGPSGRFTNGKNVIDLLSQKLNFNPWFIPPFADPSTRGSRIIHGVNFASGASGILDDTGSNIAGQVMSLNEQIRNFEKITLPELETQVGISNNKSSSSSASQNSKISVGNYLFVVGSGGNDYSFNYFLRKPKTHNNATHLLAFTSNLTASLTQQLKKLYSLGGRKMVLMSINPLGCSPMVKINNPTRIGCSQGLNRAVNLFNTQLKFMVDGIKPEMPGSTLVFVNTYKIIRDIIRNPSSQGFKEASKPCCEVAMPNEGGNGILCKRGGQVCQNRSDHVFFDGLHPTEAVNVQIANKAFASTLRTEVYPTNIQRLTKRA